MAKVTQHVLMELPFAHRSLGSKAMLKHPARWEEQKYIHRPALPSLVPDHSMPSLHQNLPLPCPGLRVVPSTVCVAESGRGRLPGATVSVGDSWEHCPRGRGRPLYWELGTGTKSVLRAGTEAAATGPLPPISHRALFVLALSDRGACRESLGRD